MQRGAARAELTRRQRSYEQRRDSARRSYEDMLFNDQGKIENIVPVVRNDAHRIIEECMLAANVCSADFIAQSKHPGLFRVHEGPTPEKKEILRIGWATFVRFQKLQWLALWQIGSLLQHFFIIL